MAAYSKLTEAERERLEMLIEEAGEIITAGTKILRHGYDSYHPGDPVKTPNRFELEREIVDLCAVAREMDIEGDVEFIPSITDFANRWKKKLRWTHHQNGSPE